MGKIYFRAMEWVGGWEGGKMGKGREERDGGDGEGDRKEER